MNMRFRWVLQMYEYFWLISHGSVLFQGPFSVSAFYSARTDGGSPAADEELPIGRLRPPGVLFRPFRLRGNRLRRGGNVFPCLVLVLQNTVSGNFPVAPPFLCGSF